MKKIILAGLFSFFALSLFAQIKDPVKWSFASVKKGVGTYQIIATANVSAPWHIYSQSTPDGGPIATKFTFTKNPLVGLTGKPKETGALQTTHDKNFGVDVKYYGSKVVFTQIVKVKGNVKTNVNGAVEYMVCNDHECLPPHSTNFSVKLQ